jgi:hypothetical protein
MMKDFKILPDPRAESSLSDLRVQFDFVTEINEKITEAHQAILDIRDIRKQLNHFSDRLKEDESMKDMIEKAKAIDEQMKEVEESLYQTKNRSRQDPLNYPIQLTDKLGGVGSLSSRGNFRPTKQAIQVKEELTKAINAELSKFAKIKATDLPEFNRLMREKAVDAIILQEKDPTQ